MSKKKGGLGKFLIGAGIGAGLGMLLTKKTGKENREILKEKTTDLIEKLKEVDSKELKNDVEKKLKELTKEGRESLFLSYRKVHKIKRKTKIKIEHIKENSI